MKILTTLTLSDDYSFFFTFLTFSRNFSSFLGVSEILTIKKHWFLNVLRFFSFFYSFYNFEFVIWHCPILIFFAIFFLPFWQFYHFDNRSLLSTWLFKSHFLGTLWPNFAVSRPGSICIICTVSIVCVRCIAYRFPTQKSALRSAFFDLF